MEHSNWNDWIAIKQDPFKVTQTPSKLLINIAWNEIEAKFAITCQERHRYARDKNKRAWADLLSLSDIIYVHQQLSLVSPSLSTYLPISLDVKSTDVSSSTCIDLERYFSIAVDKCGRSVVIDLLFIKSTGDEFTEDLDKLERISYEADVKKYTIELEDVNKMRTDAVNMLNTTAIYTLEDEVIRKLNVALSELYNYLLGPHLDSRELAYSKLTLSRHGLQSDDVGPRVKEECQRAIGEWSRVYATSVQNIEQLYVEFYKKSSDLVKGQLDRMMNDREKFGKATFEVMGMNRFNKIDLSAREEKLKFLNTVKRNKEREKEKLEQEISQNKYSAADAKKFEDDYFKKQISILDLKIEICKVEEALIRRKIEILDKIQIDQSGVFYETAQNEEELDSIEENDKVIESVEKKQLKDRLTQICLRKAKLRNQKNACTASRSKQVENVRNELDKQQKHHAVQIKIAAKKTKAETDKEKLEKEKSKTIKRIKAFREKYKSINVYDTITEDVSTTITDPIPISTLPASSPFPPPSPVIDSTSPISIPPPPPPPPPISLTVGPPLPLPLPPPPPPPPPLLQLPNSDVLKSLRIVKELKPVDNKMTSSQAGISLRDVLNARGNLRRNVSHEIKTSQSNDASSDDVTNALRNAISKLRNVVADSDESSSDSDRDFD